MEYEVKPIKKMIRNKGLLSLLENQFSSGTEIGIEYVDSRTKVIHNAVYNYETYRVCTRKNSNEPYSEDRFIIERVRKNGKIKKYKLNGSIYF
jgi:hypothetical protein